MQFVVSLQFYGRQYLLFLQLSGAMNVGGGCGFSSSSLRSGCASVHP